jgi:hypothetical protein
MSFENSASHSAEPDKQSQEGVEQHEATILDRIRKNKKARKVLGLVSFLTAINTAKECVPEKHKPNEIQIGKIIEEYPKRLKEVLAQTDKKSEGIKEYGLHMSDNYFDRSHQQVLQNIQSENTAKYGAALAARQSLEAAGVLGLPENHPQRQRYEEIKQEEAIYKGQMKRGLDDFQRNP